MAENPFRSNVTGDARASDLVDLGLGDDEEEVVGGFSSNSQQQQEESFQSSKKPSFYESGDAAASSSTAGLIASVPMTASTSSSSGINGSARGAAPDSSMTSRLCGFLSIDFYRPYFDVNTEAVQARLLGAVNPASADIFSSTPDFAPDLYGPFWIATTLVFLIGASSNLNSFFAKSEDSKEPWDRDYTLLSLAATLIYTYAFLGPVAVWGFVKYTQSGANASLISLLSLYGYAMFAFVPAALLCIIPNGAVQWIVVLVAFVLSGAVLSRNLGSQLGAIQGVGSEARYNQVVDTETTSLTTETGVKRRTIASIVLVAILAHATFSLLLKLFFFQGADVPLPTHSPTAAATVLPSTLAPTATMSPTKPPKNNKGG